MSDLTLYEKAKQALSEYKTVDEVKRLRDRAMAMRTYAQQANDKSLEADAIETRLRAERRLGEMMAIQRETVGLNPGAAVPTRVSEKPTLAEAGIDKNLAHRARGAAAISEDLFEYKIAEMREKVIEGNGRRLPEYKPGTPQPRSKPVVVIDATPFAAKLRRTMDEWRSFYLTQTNPITDQLREEFIQEFSEWINQAKRREWP